MGGGQREAALQELHDRHASELWRFAMRLTHDRQLSEDVVQEVLLKAWKDPSLGQRDEAAARAWLFTASRNLIIDRWRSAASRHEQRMEDPPEESAGDATSVVLDRWLIADALGSLSRGAPRGDQRRLLRGQVGGRHLGPAPDSGGHREVAAALRTPNAQIGTTGERSDSAVNAIPDKFAQWDAAYVLGALSPAERREFEEHLASCPACQAAVSELVAIPGLLAQVSPADAAMLAMADDNHAGTVKQSPPVPARKS